MELGCPLACDSIAGNAPNRMDNIRCDRRTTIILMFTVGSDGAYKWLVTDTNFDLLQLCPEIVLGKYVAITSIDSGWLRPTEKEIAAGWQSRAKIAYSPKIEIAQDVPHEWYDEWYIFDTPTDLGTSHLEENIFEVTHDHGHLSVFVNYGFALHPPERAHKDLVTLFWEQIMRIRPESYVADNDYLTFVTRNEPVFASVLDAVKALT
jgi:hypothetical protein